MLRATRDGGIETVGEPVGGPIPDRSADYESWRSNLPWADAE